VVSASAEDVLVERFIERAAIIEADGQLSRSESETLAAQQVFGTPAVPKWLRARLTNS